MMAADRWWQWVFTKPPLNTYKKWSPRMAMMIFDDITDDLQSLDWVYSSVSNSRFVPTINLCLWVCSNLNRNLPEPDELKANVANGNCGESQTLNKSLKICPGKSCPLGLLQTVSVKSQKRHCLMDLQDNDRTYRVTLPRAQSTQ